MSAAVGTLGKAGIGATSPVTYMVDFKSERFIRQDESVNGNGVRGTRAHHISRVRAGLQRVAGPFGLQPQAADLVQLLPWVNFGSTTTVSGTNKWFKLGETAVARYLTIDRHAKVFTYSTVGVDKAKWSCEQGQLLNLDLDLIGASETVGNAGTFPALDADLTTNPFILSDLAITVGGTTITAKKFEVEINNFIDPDRFFNSNVLTALVARDREIIFRTQVPYGDFTALYNLGAATGVAVVATFTSGSLVLVFNMQKVVFPPIGPNVEGRSEVMMPLEGRAYKTGALTDDTGMELINYLDIGV